VRIRGLAAALAIVTLYPTKPVADVSLAIIEYRVIQAVGQVRLTTGYVHDPGHGYRGGLATADVVVTVDGKKVIDCAYDGGPTELDDVGILPRDGMISILGSYDGKHVQSVISLTGNQTIDPTWLARNVK
jgi:hypothetical protein